MSAAHDRQFTDLFTLVLGALVGIAFGIYFLSIYISSRTQSEQVLQDPEYQRQVLERIAPVARLAVAGQDNSALALIEPAATAPGGAAVSDAVLPGEEVYRMACFACHDQGIAGAPKFGDRAAWASHVVKGMDVLRQSAINGIQSELGTMPPKGGRTDLSDQSVINAVDYMIEAVN